MEIYQLRTFAAVAEHGQLTRAGEALHVSQPAITAQIKALEDEFQVGLFARTSHGMRLTRAGENLLEHAESVLSAVQVLKNQAKALSGKVNGKLSIGTVADPEFIRLGALLNIMLERFPLVELDLHQRVSGQALEDVRNGTLNASFYFGELSNAKVTRLRLCDVVYRVAAPAAWKDTVEGANWAEIAALPWIMAPPVSTHNLLLQELFRNQGVEPTKVVEADQENILNSLIESGVGISLMREDQALAAQRASKIIIWGNEKPSTTLWLIFPTEQAQDAAIVALTDAISELWSKNQEQPFSRAVG